MHVSNLQHQFMSPNFYFYFINDRNSTLNTHTWTTGQMLSGHEPTSPNFLVVHIFVSYFDAISERNNSHLGRYFLQSDPSYAENS
jgi:hypothetical protein